MEFLLAVVLALPAWAGGIVYAQPREATIAVTATVLPHIYVIVDEHGQVNQIYSNGHSQSDLIILANSLSSQRIPITADVFLQYCLLLPELDFSKSGVLYQKPNFQQRILQNALLESKIF